MFGVMTRHEEELEWSEFDRLGGPSRDVFGLVEAPIELRPFQFLLVARHDPEHTPKYCRGGKGSSGIDVREPLGPRDEAGIETVR